LLKRQTGFCGGGCSIVVPVYITETASVKIRGMLASGFDMFITVGIFYMYVIVPNNVSLINSVSDFFLVAALMERKID
jgi:hypothetical protein